MRFLFVLTFGFMLFAAAEGFSKETDRIRVAVLRDRPDVILAVRGSYEIQDARTKEVLDHGRNLSFSRVAASVDGLKIKNTVFKTGAVTVIAKRTAGITVNNRSYRGDISVYKDLNGRLLVVNAVDLESYVKGVLYHEISNKWPIDAIKAQAIATRTYAIYTKETMRAKDYDVTADTSSQVYGGYLSEKHKTNRAVNFTAGEILEYKDRVFPAYFHATCGGNTEDVVELWKIDTVPLRGGSACSFCSDSPHYYWRMVLDLKNIRKKLGRRYVLEEPLQNIGVCERTTTGRVRSLELKDASGKSQVISSKDFRSLLGADVVRSTNFSIALEQDHVVLSGKGWGHGVGLCQWGALGMSKKGYTYRQILEFYYPGADLVKLR